MTRFVSSPHVKRGSAGEESQPKMTQPERRMGKGGVWSARVLRATTRYARMGAASLK